MEDSLLNPTEMAKAKNMVSQKKTTVKKEAPKKKVAQKKTIKLGNGGKKS